MKKIFVCLFVSILCVMVQYPTLAQTIEFTNTVGQKYISYDNGKTWDKKVIEEIQKYDKILFTNTVGQKYISYDNGKTWDIVNNISKKPLMSEDNMSLGIFPNPVEDYLTIDADYHNYEIFNISGKLILKGQNSSGRINLSELESGTYIIAVENKLNNCLTKKFIKK